MCVIITMIFETPLSQGSVCLMLVGKEGGAQQLLNFPVT